MTETNSSIPEKIEKKSNLQKILGGFMVLLILLLGWQLFEQKSVSEKERGEKEEVKEELFELLDQYEQLNSNNEELNSELRTKESEIKDMIVNLEKLEKKSKEQAWLLNKYKKESKTLRSLLKGYLYEIDSLNKTIHVLEEEKTIVEDNFSKEQVKTANLTKEKNELTQKVAVGSKYKIYNLLTVGVRAKSGGREKEEKRARKIGKIKTCFTIGENDLVKSGERKVYIRVYNEEGIVFPAGGDSTKVFAFEETVLAYSSKRIINYQNKPVDVCIYFNWPEFNPGNYSIDIFADGNQIGESFITLE